MSSIVAFEPDHLTSLWIPGLPSDAGSALAAFEEVARRLRIECPWDRIQTHDSLRPFVLEEAAEVVEAIDALGDEPTDTEIAALESELGDLLFQVVIHATLGAETGWFDLASVIRGIQDKLVGRHPHVFGDETATTPAEAAVLWRAAKAAERARRRRLGLSCFRCPCLTSNVPLTFHTSNISNITNQHMIDQGDV